MEYYKNLSLKNIVYFCDVDLIEKIEQWKDVVGYEGIYQVSDLGRIKSLDRISTHSLGGSKKIKGKILSQSLSNGYLTIVICSKGITQTKNIQILISISFLNHTPCGYMAIVDHKDNNRLNNKLSNLQIISSRLNSSKDKVNNKNLYTGVKQNTLYRNKWESHIRIRKEKVYLGIFNCPIKASNIYQLAIKNIDKYNGVSKDFRILLNSLN